MSHFAGGRDDALVNSTRRARRMKKCKWLVGLAKRVPALDTSRRTRRRSRASHRARGRTRPRASSRVPSLLEDVFLGALVAPPSAPPSPAEEGQGPSLLHFPPPARGFGFGIRVPRSFGFPSLRPPSPPPLARCPPPPLARPCSGASRPRWDPRRRRGPASSHPWLLRGLRLTRPREARRVRQRGGVERRASLLLSGSDDLCVCVWGTGAGFPSAAPRSPATGTTSSRRSSSRAAERRQVRRRVATATSASSARQRVRSGVRAPTPTTTPPHSRRLLTRRRARPRRRVPLHERRRFGLGIGRRQRRRERDPPPLALLAGRRGGRGHGHEAPLRPARALDVLDDAPGRAGPALRPQGADEPRRAREPRRPRGPLRAGLRLGPRVRPHGPGWLFAVGGATPASACSTRGWRGGGSRGFRGGGDRGSPPGEVPAASFVAGRAGAPALVPVVASTRPGRRAGLTRGGFSSTASAGSRTAGAGSSR